MYTIHHSVPQTSRINSIIIGVLSAAIAIGAGMLSFAGFVAA